MTWPHVLSLSRVVVSPVIAALILVKPGDADLLAAILFSLASITDLLDGKLARYTQCVSPLGIFLDTTADKVLVSLTLIALALAGLTPAWIPLVIIGREFLVSGLRSYAASCDRIISAHIWGKGKAASTMVAVGLLLLAEDGRAHGLLAASLSHSAWQNAFNICLWLLGLSAVLTVISGIRYFVDAWPLFRPGPVPVEARDAPRPRRAAGMDR